MKRIFSKEQCPFLVEERLLNFQSAIFCPQLYGIVYSILVKSIDFYADDGN